MSIQDSKKEERSLAKFVRAKLSIPVSKFSELDNTNVSTLYERWKSADGRLRVMDSVQRIYFDRYYEL